MTSSLHRQWLMVGVLWGTSVPAVAEPCPAIAIVEGPSALRDLIITKLTARAIETNPHGDCPKVIARVSEAEAGVAVSISDPSGRVSGRQVADVATATSLIESWARPELNGMLLSTRHLVRLAQVPEREEPDVLARKAIPPATIHGPPIRLAFDASSSVGSDGSLWLGFSGLACVRFGATCAGVMGRVSQDTELHGDSETLQTARRAIDLMLVLDVPRVHHGWSWTPGVQIGLAFNRSVLAPESGMASTGNVEVDGGGLRVGAHIAIAKRLGGRWALGLDVAVDTSVFSPADATDMEALRIAGQPRGFLRGGLQLRYEGM